MKIITLMDNTTNSEHLAAEHGLSLYIETDKHKILFDTGESNAFADNAKQLGVDLSAIDICILSHGHYDHSGGLLHFLSVNKQAPLYLSKHAFSACYHGQERYIGIDPQLAIQDDRLVYTDDICVIDEGLTLFSCNEKEKRCPIDSAGLTVLENGVYQDDLFLHEQYLLIEENKKRILISGCSHKGILNIADWFRPDVLFGGFHFMNLDPETEDADRLRSSASVLLTYPTVYYTGHCTGQAPFDFMKAIMGEKLHAIHSGFKVTL